MQWGELSLFSRCHKDFGVEIIGEGVQVSVLGDQKDRGAITEQERRRNGCLGGIAMQGGDLHAGGRRGTAEEECRSWNQLLGLNLGLCVTCRFPVLSVPNLLFHKAGL